MGTVMVMDTLTEREIRMWWIRQRKISLGKNGFFRGFYDCHSHLLPGVDDGLQQMEQSLELLAELEEAGVACLWLTPHVAEDMPNTTAALEERFGLLKERYRGRMALRLAAEYMLDAGFSERLEKRDLLTLGQRRVLVETSFAGAPYNFWSLLDQIKEAGYSPVLAHPERYLYMGKEEYDKLKKNNIALQLNLPSLAGYYGKAVCQRAGLLLKEGYYQHVGCDIHSRSYWHRLSVTELSRKMAAEVAVLVRNNKEKLI